MSEFNPYDQNDLNNHSADVPKNQQTKPQQSTSKPNMNDPDPPIEQEFPPGLFGVSSDQDQSESGIYEWNFSDYEKLNQNTDSNTNKHSKGLVVLAVTLSVLLVLIVMMFAIYVAYENDKISTPPVDQNEVTNNGPNLTINDPPSTTEDNTSANSNEMTTTEIASKVTPSIVGIQTYSKNTSYQTIVEGSGIIISDDGYIVTSAHILIDKNNQLVSSINVGLNNGAEHEAQMIGIDTKTDLAVIKINASGLLHAEFGNSDQVKLGERVLAIGNPKELEFTGSISQGIVSGLHNSINISSNTSISLIQTDANINIGNAGGALVNVYGQVIGINTTMLNEIDYDQKGLAIPSNNAQPIIDDLIQYGHVQNRVKTGLSFQMINNALSKAGNIPKGLYITEIESNTDASLKGLSVGDIVTKIDGKDITSYQTLYDMMSNKTAGETLNLTIYRTSKINKSSTFELDVVLIEDYSGIDNHATIESQYQSSVSPFQLIQ